MASLSDPLAQELLHGRYLASLATENPDGSLHLTAVWFYFDGDSLYVATSSRTRKARNLEARPRASLMVDSRDPLASRAQGFESADRHVIVGGKDSIEMGAGDHQLADRGPP